MCRKYTGIIYKHTQINEHILNTFFNNVNLRQYSYWTSIQIKCWYCQIFWKVLEEKLITIHIVSVFPCITLKIVFKSLVHRILVPGFRYLIFEPLIINDIWCDYMVYQAIWILFLHVPSLFSMLLKLTSWNLIL